MSILNLTLTSAEPTVSLTALQVNGDKASGVQKVVDFLQRMNSGGLKGGASLAPALVVATQDNASPATGSFTCTSVLATHTCSVNGVTFTAVASGATGNQFNIGVSDAECALSLTAAIANSATALASAAVTPSYSTNVVAFTSKVYGIAGNWITISSGQGTIVASGARLTGGAADAGSITFTF